MLGVILVASPVVSAFVRGAITSASGGIPSGDGAFIAAAAHHARGLGAMLGPYSRYGFAHPGPAMFYLLAPFAGGRGDITPLYVVTGAFSLATSLALVAELSRAASNPLVRFALAAIVAGFTSTLTSVHFLDVAVVHPWNPLVSVWALFGVVAASAAILEGRTEAAVPGALALALAVQSHVTGVPFGIVFLVLVAPALRAAFVTGGRRRRHVLAAAAVLTLAFVPVVVEAVLHGGGNLVALVGAARHGVPGAKSFVEVRRVIFILAAPTLGVLGALGVKTDRFGMLPSVVVGVVTVLAIGGAIRARRAGHAEVRTLARLTWATAIGTLLVLPFVRGHTNAHPFYPIGLFGVMLHATAAACWLYRAPTPSPRWILPLALVVVVLGVHTDRLTTARRDELSRSWPPPRVLLAIAGVSRCVAARGPFALRVEGKSGWVPAATAAYVGLANGVVPVLDRHERPWFGEAFAYGSLEPTPLRPTLVVATLPLDSRVTRDVHPYIDVNLKVDRATPPAREAALQRCLDAMPRRRRR